MICEKEKCTGCFACYNICPRNAIMMEENELGYIYPKIDKLKCINCNLCKKICPSIQNVESHKIKAAFAMWNKDDTVRRESTSGGLATTIYTAILKRNGVIYGCTNSLDDGINFIRIDNVKDLYKVKGSKYVHAYVNDNFKKIKEDLENNRKVLFIGTPCQVAGLKKFLMKEYENLYAVDIICHGVPPQKLLKEEINLKIKEQKNLKITFRENGNYCMKVYSNNTKILDELKDKNFYLLAFIKSLFFRENCYNCLYANPNRIGDITIGDFWGIGKEDNTEYKYKNEERKGISLCLLNTDKGKKLLDLIKEESYLEERNISEAILGNSQLRYPSTKNSEYQKFKEIYQKKGYKIASKKCLRYDKFKQIIKKKIEKK